MADVYTTITTTARDIANMIENGGPFEEYSQDMQLAGWKVWYMDKGVVFKNREVIGLAGGTFIKHVPDGKKIDRVGYSLVGGVFGAGGIYMSKEVAMADEKAEVTRTYRECD